MTRVSIWIARRPEDELAEAIAAADRRRTMDALKVRVLAGIDRKRMMATLKRRVDASRPKSTGDAVRSAGSLTSSASTHHRRAASPAPRKQGLHDPFNTCEICAEYRRLYPAAAAALTASSIPRGCPPHPWNEKPKSRRAWMR